MDIGMLWFDDDKKRTLADKVSRAVDFYSAKHGIRPTECHIHPATIGESQLPAVAGVRLLPNRTIVKDHFWLGIGDEV